MNAYDGLPKPDSEATHSITLAEIGMADLAMAHSADPTPNWDGDLATQKRIAQEERAKPDWPDEELDGEPDEVTLDGEIDREWYPDDLDEDYR
jgi:hypothetical protein